MVAHGSPTATVRLQDLADALFYGPIPALIIGRDEQILDYNLALESLFGDALGGIRGRTSGVLHACVSELLVEGVLLPMSSRRSGADSSSCTLSLADLGMVRLDRKTIAYEDVDTGETLGTVAFWKPQPFANGEKLHERYRKILDHQMTWDTYARSYDRILPLMPYYKDVLRRHRDALCADPCWPVIDLGAGTGNLTTQLVDAGLDVIAVDTSRAMLGRLRSKATIAPNLGGRVRVIEASAGALTMLDSETCGGASILLALYDMETPQAALNEAIRILRPGGTLVITEPKLGFRLEPILHACREQLERLGLLEELRDDLGRVIEANRTLDPAPRAPLRAETIRQILGNRGFHDVRFADSHFGQCATVTARKPSNGNAS